MQEIQRRIQEEIGYEFPKDTKFIPDSTFLVERTQGKVSVHFAKKYQIARAALVLKTKTGDFSFTEQTEFEDLCFMLDCSRNAVNSLPAVKKLIRNLACMGYNSLMLYTEDTYEVEGEPQFGYMRGRYTQKEIKELDAYAKDFDMELIPCIQTLAHLNSIVRYREYETHIDCNDILLVGDERVYELIENMFKSLQKCFTTRRCHIGMDEAGMLGVGKYLADNGYRKRFDIFMEHLNKVSKIAEKYGFSTMMWSDMFLKIAREESKEFDAEGNVVIPQAVIESMPDNVSAVHWNYGCRLTDAYRRSFKMHAGMKNPVWFAVSSYKCVGFLPFNGLSRNEFDTAFTVMREQGITHSINCGWADDGSECSLFSVLPSMLYFSCKAYNWCEEDYRSQFYALTGYTYEEFLTIEYPNSMCGQFVHDYCNPTKICLYNDVFCPQFDLDLDLEDVKDIKRAIRLMQKSKEGQYAYIFENSIALAKIAVEKYDFGVCLRKAYQEQNTEQIKVLLGRLKKIIAGTKAFLETMRVQWFTENKPNGFDIQEYRLGGLITRLQGCYGRLKEYIEGTITEIPELQEKVYRDFFSGRETERRFHYNSFLLTASVNKF